MITIHKFDLQITDAQEIYVPGFIKVLSVGVQYSETYEREYLRLWCIVNDADKDFGTYVPICIVGTGKRHTIPVAEFMGSHVMANGTLVWHVWHGIPYK